MYTDDMPMSIREELAYKALESAVLELFAAKMEDLGCPNWDVNNQGDFWQTDGKRSTLAKEALRLDISRILFKIKDDGLEMGKQQH